MRACIFQLFCLSNISTQTKGCVQNLLKISGVVANLELGERSGSVYSRCPSVGGIVVLGGTTRRRSLRPEGPKIEA